MRNVVTAILGGGQGTRLWPLTKNRAKPAVPVGGKFRLINIPISNSLHAGINRIFVLTQFNTASLHQHISQTYRFDVFSRGFVNIMAAEQTLENRDWYQGTADAVRQNLDRLLYASPSKILVLSGDQLYLMDMRDFVLSHRQRKAEVSIAVKAVRREEAKGLGIMRVNSAGRIVEFVEKPSEPEVLDRLAINGATARKLGFEGEDGALLASMGIYVFNPGVLKELLPGNTDHDFGKQVIPKAIHDHKIYAFAYNGYWRDIGTIGSFHRSNFKGFAVPVPPLNLYSPDYPIYTHARFLPGVKITECKVFHSVICDGSIVSGGDIHRSILGVRSVVRTGTRVENTVVMGANFYEPDEKAGDRVRLGIGEGCVIENAILDRDVRIGNGVKLINKDGLEHADSDNYCIRDGIIVVPATAVIPDGTEI